MSSIGNLAKDLYTIMHNADEKGPKPYEPVATVVKNDEKNDDVLWVKLPGGNSETPVEKTMDAAPGDKVRLRVSGGRAWVIGNGTSPPASSEATIKYIQNGLEYDPTFAENFSNSIVQNSTIVNSAVENAIVKNSEIVESRIYNSNIENFTVINGVVQDLEATDAIIQGHLEAHDAEFESLDTTYATIENLEANYATINELHSDYAEIDLANVNNAWIEYGAMKKAEVFDENVFDLSGDHATIRKIDASKINVANLNADNLIVRRINGQPVVGGYTLISNTSPGYSSKNPQALGWYEFVNAQWVLSTDTTVDETKAYYQEGNEVSLYDQTYIDGLQNDLQQQIDGAVETFTGTVVPTLVNWPYTDWYDTSVTPVHDERAKHIGDIYYVVNSASDQNGYCYRFAFDNTQNVYSWVLIKDSDVTKALSDISELQTFESTTTSWMDETDEGIETIRTNYTSLSGKVDKTVKESIQLWFTKANTTAPNKPTAEITSTSTDGNGWRVVVPAYNASYPNYFYCWQYKFVDNTFGWSNVVRDIAMGETQGMSRDAKNTADAALPASTFETFESTTFTDLVDEVDEQSTTMTNMTTRLGMNADGTGAATDIVAKESALEQTVDGISTRVGKTETKLIGMYATSTTAAGTAAKVATITPALPSGATWELDTGTMITVKFMNENTAASPTLNVNSKGAKGIRVLNSSGTVTTLSADEYKWAAGSTFTFTYNGTYWLMQDSSVSVRMNSNETSISQTADSIVSLASNQSTYTKPDGTTGTNAIKSAITQTANSIESVVANNDTYTAPDGSTKTNVIKSAITQNANDISLRVEKSGVIAAINASVEEQGGSAVKISADKVNIEGAAIFTSGRLSSTSLDNAYDAKGSADDALDDAKGYVDGKGYQTASDVSNAVANGVSGKADKTAAVGRSQRIYYRKTSSGAPSKNTTWLATSGTGYGNWSLKVPQLTSGTTKYPYLYTAVQTQTVSQMSGTTCSCSDVLLDDTTTIIDGGTIITGTVNANAVNASSGTFDTANIPNLNASKITAGDIAADRMKVNSITAINSLTTGKINASRLDVGSITVGSLSDGSSYSTTSQMNTAIGNAVDGIDVGGRNLLKVNGSSISKTTYRFADIPLTEPLVAGETYTLQLWGVSLDANSTGIGVYWGSGNNNLCTFARQNGHLTNTFTVTSAQASHADASNLTIYLYSYPSGRSDYNTSITKWKLEKGNKATDWTPAPEDIVNDNLLIDSQKMGSWQIGANASLDSSGEFGVATITGNTSWHGVIYSKPTISTSILDGSPLWLSFEYQYSEATAIAVSLAGTSAAVDSTTSITRTKYLTKYPVLKSTNTWTKYSIQMPSTVAELTSGSGDVNSIYVQFYNYYTANSTLKIRKVKLEHGIGSTDWTPSPQDQKAYITRISDTGIKIHPANSSGNDYAQIDGSAIQFWRNGQSMSSMTDTDVRIGRNDKQHVRINPTSGMTIWKGEETSASNNVANYSDTVRIGREDSYKTLISAGGIQLVDGTGSNSFGIEPSGNSILQTHIYSTELVATVHAFTADISHYTITFKLADGPSPTDTIYQETTRTNSQLAVGESFVLGGIVSGVNSHCTVTRTGTNSFTISSISGLGNLFTASWTSTTTKAKILYTGANSILVNDVVQYMQASQTVYLSEPVSAQLNGIVLAWSAYESGAAKNWDWNYTFVPKNHVLLFNGNGVGSGLMTATGALSYVGSKYVKVYDDKIEGYAGNESSGTAKGITYNNNHWVLRYVYGV